MKKSVTRQKLRKRKLQFEIKTKQTRKTFRTIRFEVRSPPVHAQRLAALSCRTFRFQIIMFCLLPESMQVARVQISGSSNKGRSQANLTAGFPERQRLLHTPLPLFARGDVFGGRWRGREGVAVVNNTQIECCGGNEGEKSDKGRDVSGGGCTEAIKRSKSERGMKPSFLKHTKYTTRHVIRHMQNITFRAAPASTTETLCSNDVGREPVKPEPVWRY